MIEYHVSTDGLIVESFPEGELNAGNMKRYHERIADDPSVRSGATEIVDLSKLDNLVINCRECEHIPWSYRKEGDGKHISSTVFLCPTDWIKGIGRILQKFHQVKNPSHCIAIADNEIELGDILSSMSS